MKQSFWSSLQKPIIALSPMDGVTDAAFRYIVDTYGKPSILFTEFTSVEGIAHGATKLLDAFIHHTTSTPTVAQLFGANPEDFYKAAFVTCEMGFNGIDINMGCPDAAVARKGGGAALILKPEIAKQIIRHTKKGVADWSNGKSIKESGLPDSITTWVDTYKKHHEIEINRVSLPVSVKTRIGYHEPVTEPWIQTLLEEEPVAISVHGRTLKQMYTGAADWNEIGKAAALIKKTKTLALGNGDIKTVAEARKKAREFHLDGTLIGRASFGNPWIFQEFEATKEERIQVAIEHCEAFMRLTPDLHFLSLRKHLAWYMKGFEGSHELRKELMKVENLADVRRVLKAQE